MGLAPGFTALAVLGASALVGPLLGYAVARLTGHTGKAQFRVAVLSVACGTVALVFWAWALRNCIVGATVDGGVVSFATVVWACAFSFHILNRRVMPSSCCTTWAMPCTMYLVALNYIIGVVVALKTPTVALYFCCGAAWWLAAGTLGLLFARGWVQDLDAAMDKEASPHGASSAAA
mmetsp:Transcript_67319/g.173335  ORF Transcript_67319/g.173335 Transcript_67319/m.173335 type:complete len:177 (+) Transcript_67319:1-531(+)